MVAGDSLARQHRVVVCRANLETDKSKRVRAEPQIRWWKLKAKDCYVNEEVRESIKTEFGNKKTELRRRKQAGVRSNMAGVKSQAAKAKEKAYGELYERLDTKEGGNHFRRKAYDTCGTV